MKLFGSTTSPFVRRLRLYLLGQDSEFIDLDIFSEHGREILSANNPAQKVPILQDGELTLYDSRVIYRYLAQRQGDSSLSWSQENLLTLIDAVNDSFVSILLLSRSGFDTSQDNLFANLQNERIKKVLEVLETEVTAGAFNDWSYASICLFCLLDWIDFRDLYSLNNYPHLSNFFLLAKKNSGIAETDPR